MTKQRTANNGFASGGVMRKLEALCFETHPNAKPENLTNNEAHTHYTIHTCEFTFSGE